VLIQSDIPAQRPGTATNDAEANGQKSSKKVRVRVEEDKDFRGDRRKRKQPTKKFEEIEVESGDEDLEEETTNAYQPASRSERRSRKQGEEDEDLPEMLPENFKDGSVNAAKSERRKERRQTMPAGENVPKIRPAGFRKSTGALGPNGTPGSGKKRGRPSNAAMQAQAAALARAALDAEENRKAKLAAAGVDLDDDEGFDDADRSPDALGPRNGFTPVNGSKGPTIIRKSIFSGGNRPGGRKIKIVAKNMGTLGVSDDEESDSEADIPSSMPVRKGPPGRKFLPGVAA
jgi:hypothetical protein